MHASHNFASHDAVTMTEVVDQGLVMLQTMDREPVAQHLIRSGVRFSVIVRVLAEPKRRRLRHLNIQPSTNVTRATSMRLDYAS